MELTLVPTDKLTKEELTVPASSPDAGFSKYTKDAELLPAALDKLSAPKDAIQVEFPAMQKIGNYALDVKSKDQAVASSADLAARFWYGYGYHTIKVTNRYIKPIYAYFLYYAGGLWHYSGYNYKLNYNTYATYWNCARSVGAEVDYPPVHNYRVVFFVYC